MAASKAEKKLLGDFRQQIQDDLSWREYWGESHMWDTWDRYYRSKFAEEVRSPYNVFFPHLRSMTPQVYFRNPSISLTTNRLSGPVKAAVAERLLQHWMYVSGIKEEIQLATHDCWLCGSAFGLVGWDDGEAPTYLTDAGYDTNRLPGYPWVRRAHPSDILLPWGARTRRDITRFVLRKWIRKDDLLESDLYAEKRSAIKKIKAKDYFYEDLGAGGKKTTSQSHEDWLVIYERHDLKTGRIYVFVDECDEFLRDEEETLQAVLSGLPVSMLLWNPNGRAVWGVSEAKILQTTQLEANSLNTTASIERRASVPKFAYDKELLDENEIINYTSETPNVGVGVDGNPNDAIKDLPSRGNPMLQLELERVLSQGREQLGHPMTRAGSYTPPTKRATAKEVEAAEYGADIPVSDRRVKTGDFLEALARKALRIMTAFWDKPRMIYAPDIDPRFSHIIFRGTDLGSNFEYRIESEEMAPPNTAQRRQEAVALGPELIKLAQVLQGAIDPMAIVNQVMKNFPSWDLSALLAPTQQQFKQARGVGLLDKSGVLIMVPPEKAAEILTGQGGVE